MHKILSRTLLVLAISAILIVSLLPEVARWQLIRTLGAQGIELEIDYLGFALRKGEIQLDGLRIQDQKELDVSLATLTLQISLLALLDNDIVLSHFSLRDLTVKLPNQQKMNLGAVELDGNISVQMPDTTEGSTKNYLSVAMPEGLQLNELSVSQEQQSIVQFYEGTINGLHLELLNGTNSMESISLTLNDVVIEDISILGLPHIKPQPTEGFSEHISLDRFRLTQLAFQQSSKDDASPGALSIHSLALEGLNALLLKVNEQDATEQDKGRSAFPLADAIQALQVPEKPSAGVQGTPDSQAPPLISLGEIKVNKGSQFTLIDSSHTPATVRTFNEIEIRLNDIHQAKPKEPSAFSISAKADEYGSLHFQGEVKLFSQAVNARVTGQVKSFDLSPFSAYAENAAAHKIKSGHLNANVEGAIVDNNIDVQVLLDLRKFYLENLEKKERPDDVEASSMPLATALNLLRDNDDRIEFKLPVNGDVNAPDFSIQHIIGIVARKAITETVINYYTPFGLVGLGSALVSSATQLRFEPVKFAAGKNAFASGADKNITQLAALLSKKQSLTLTLCPISTAGDWRQQYKQRESAEVKISPEQRAELEALGLERGATLKSKLVDKAVAAEQVVVCKAAINEKEMGAGFVGIEL